MVKDLCLSISVFALHLEISLLGVCKKRVSMCLQTACPTVLVYHTLGGK